MTMRYRSKSGNVYAPRVIAWAFARLTAASIVADRAMLAIDVLSCFKPGDLIRQQDSRKIS